MPGFLTREGARAPSRLRIEFSRRLDLVIRHTDRNQEAVVQNCLKHHSDIFLQRLSDRRLVAYRRESARPQHGAGFNTDEFGIGLDDVLLRDRRRDGPAAPEGIRPERTAPRSGTPERIRSPCHSRVVNHIGFGTRLVNCQNITRLSQSGGTEKSSVI